MLKEFEPRVYQQTIFSKTINENTLVVLPTGLGKTAIAAMLSSYRLDNYKNSKIIFLAPTKPLCEQHLKSFKEIIDLDSEKFVLFTGSVSPEKRHEQFKKAQIIISTPQGLENDIISNKIDLSDVSLFVFDEAHRATGNYSYVFIAKQYRKKANHERILALTASPGSDKETIKEICQNLLIENIEIKTEEDEDVKPYIHEANITYQSVDLPQTFSRIIKFLDTSYKNKIKAMLSLGVIKQRPQNKTDLLKMQRATYAKISQGEKNFEILKTISLFSEAIKIQHTQELIETQGIYPLRKYFEKLKQEANSGKSKAVKNLLLDENFKSAMQLADSSYDNEEDHPKIDKILEILTEELNKKPEQKTIIFTQFRDQAVSLKKRLDSKGMLSKIFVGQAKKNDTGLSQKQQQEMLEEFRNGLFNLLIATSVAEEGLDIPQVDLVIFYESTPSAIRTIQRRGRTARHAPGKIIVLVAKGTRDEGYRWSSHHKERRMYKTLEEFRKTLLFENKKLDKNKQGFEQQETLSKHKNKKGPIIYVDHREKSSPTLRELMELDANINLVTLDAGDYLVAHDTCIEFKRQEDFVDSLLDGRLFSQLKNLRKYPNAAMLVEGNADLFGLRQVHPNAIRGAIATVCLSFRVPIFYTKNHKESAAMLLQIAKKEQNVDKNEFQLHQQKPGNLDEQQIYLVASLPGVGTKLAKPLLEKFLTIKKLVNASEEELQEVELIGKTKAKKLKEIFEKNYDPLMKF